MEQNKLWAGRFKEKNDPIFEKMNRSLGFDIRLFKEDILLNKIYSKELNRLGIISDYELQQIEKGLSEIEVEINEKGLQLFTDDIEDIHSGIEHLLVKKIGEAAKKIHTGKSRNDQIATDIRKYLINETEKIKILLKSLMLKIIDLAEKNIQYIMPGYTHLRQAQPILFSHYILSFFFAFQRDFKRLNDSIKRISILPLGNAALAGSAYPLNRKNLKNDLGFISISLNSIDGVSSRDFILEFLSNISILATNLSKMAEDFIIFSSEHFNFFELSDKVTTGSSIMPNKKNPDSLELIRAKSGRIIGNMVTLFTVLKGLPSSYNKDLQEDKEPLFDTIDNIKDMLNVLIIVLHDLKINSKNMQDSIDPNSFATELADYLTLNNIPFREAHSIVGKIVLDCIESNKKLTDLKEIDLLKYSENFKNIGDNWSNIDKFLEKREILGGTGRKSVLYQISAALDFINSII